MSNDTSDSMTESSLFTDEQLAQTDLTPVDIWATPPRGRNRMVLLRSGLSTRSRCLKVLLAGLILRSGLTMRPSAL
jgi:hypothetical protein